MRFNFQGMARAAALGAAVMLSTVTVGGAQEPLQVVATTSILGDLTANVGGDLIALDVIVGANADAHSFEPAPADVLRLRDADLIIENGLEFETWLDDLVAAAETDAVRVVASDGITPIAFSEGEHEEHEGEEHDEHEDEAVTSLEPWTGEFVSAYSFGFEGMQTAWDAVMASTPELDRETLAAYWEEAVRADFDSIAFADDTVTFTSGGESVSCAYTFTTADENGGQFSTTDPACATYASLLLNPIHGGEDGSIAHFHLRYGAEGFEALMADDSGWSPSVYPAGTTAADLAPLWAASGRPLGRYIAELYGVEVALTDEETAAMQATPETDTAEEPEDEHEGEGEHAEDEHGEDDPHVWQDPANAMIMVANIRDALIDADPANEAAYTTNAEAYLAELAALDAEVTALIDAIPEDRRLLVTTHEALGYFAARYDFELISALGAVTTEGAEPAASEIAALADVIRAEGVPALFIENISDARLMETIASETGATIAPPLYTDALGEPGSAGGTYLGMIRYNAETIVAALNP